MHLCSFKMGMLFVVVMLYNDLNGHYMNGNITVATFKTFPS